jgi:hypothetical protein
MQRATIVLNDERLILRGRLAPMNRHPRRTHPGDRTCEWEGCGTRLSIYNPLALCWQHQRPARFIQRAERRTA